MSNDKKNNPWARPDEPDPCYLSRYLSPHVPLEAPSGLPLPKPLPPRISNPPPSAWTLDELFQEQVGNGVPGERAANLLRYEYLGRNFKTDIDLDRGPWPVGKDGALIVRARDDGRILDPAKVVTRQATAEDNPIHYSVIERREAALLEAEREREILEALRPAHGPMKAPLPTSPASTTEAKSASGKPPVPERDPVWEEVVKPKIEDRVAGHGLFDNRNQLVKWVIDDLKVKRSKATIIRWVAPYNGKWFTLNGPRLKRKVASGRGAGSRS